MEKEFTIPDLSFNEVYIYDRKTVVDVYYKIDKTGGSVDDNIETERISLMLMNKMSDYDNFYVGYDFSIGSKTKDRSWTCFGNVMIYTYKDNETLFWVRAIKNN